MFVRALRAEAMKLRHSPVWIAFVILPVIPAVMGAFNYIQNTGILTDTWYSLWTQQTLFSCYFFLPTTIGVYAAYLMRLEHMGHNWNAVMTAPVPVTYFILSKLISVMVMSVLTVVLTGVLFALSGILIGFETAVPLELFEWLVFGSVGTVVIGAAQLALSLMISSFAVPVGLALIGAIGGFAAYAKGFGLFFPYALLSIGMRANQPGGEMQYGAGAFLLSAAAFLVLFCGVSILWIKRKDVAAR